MTDQTISHYKVIRHIGDGTSGQVYQAEDTILRRQVALKFLPQQLTGDSEASRRFVREARATSNIDHPNICNIHEIGETGEGALFIAMTWYDGPTLKERLAQGRLTKAQALEFARQIALGLARAHESGVVHRDIKPANIIITKHDELKIVDFGLARLLTRARLTNPGTVLGTAAYMSPEQARGEDAQPASDIWSVGVVLYEMLVGRLPFHGEHEVAMIYSVLNIDPDPLELTVCPQECLCRPILNRCLARDIDKRYETAEELVQDLDKALEATEHHGSKGGSFGWDQMFGGRKRLSNLARLALGTLTVVTLALLLAWGSTGKLFSLFGEGHSRGVAVLPFTFLSDDEDELALANGLSWFTADMISRFEDETDEFWLVPPGITQAQNILSGLDAQRILGIGHTISGTGRIQDDWITLRLTINNSWQDEQVTYTIEDDLANLKTWQLDLPLLLAQDLDPQLNAETASGLNSSMTNVPSAFRSYLIAVGYARAVDSTEDYDRAKLFFSRSVAQDSSYACSRAGLGYSLWQVSKEHDEAGVRQAETFLRAATALDPQSPGPWIHLGNILVQREDFDQGRDCFTHALQLNSSSELALYGMWSLASIEGNPDLAGLYLAQALEARPDYFWALADNGIFHYSQGNYQEAESYFRRLVELAPQQQRGYNMLGTTLFEMDKYQTAETMFEKSLAIEPSYFAYSNLGTLYFYSGRLVDSVEMSRKALALDNSRFEAWRTLAESYYWTPGMRDSSRTAFRKCVAIVSDQLQESQLGGAAGDPVLRSDLATFHVSLGEFDEAKSLLTELEKETHLEIPVMFNLASAYEEMHERDRALGWLEKAVKADLSLSQVERYPGLRNLRTHPRFQALRKKYGSN